MAKHLHFASKPLQLFIQTQLSTDSIRKQTIEFKYGEWNIDPISQIARIQGKAFFNQVFFEVLDNKSFKDPESQWIIYERLVVDRQYIIDMCEHSELLNAFKFDKKIKTNTSDYSEVSFTAFCIILWDMHCKKETKQAKQIIRSFIEHYITQLFPNNKNHQPTQDELIKNISKALYQEWHIKPEIRESFKTKDDSVTFSLIAKITGFHPVTLITLEGERLKPTRKKAYKTLDEILKSDFSSLLTPTAVTAKKNTKIKSLNF